MSGEVEFYCLLFVPSCELLAAEGSSWFFDMKVACCVAHDVVGFWVVGREGRPVSASGGRLCKQEKSPSAPLRARFAPLRLQNNNIITNTTPTPITNHLIVMF